MPTACLELEDCPPEAPSCVLDVKFSELDLPTWFYLADGGLAGGCSWVGAAPDERCRLEGSVARVGCEGSNATLEDRDLHPDRCNYTITLDPLPASEGCGVSCGFGTCSITAVPTPRPQSQPGSEAKTQQVIQGIWAYVFLLALVILFFRSLVLPWITRKPEKQPYGGQGVNQAGSGRRGCDVDIPSRREVDIPSREVAARPRPQRGYSVQMSINTPQVQRRRHRARGPRARSRARAAFHHPRLRPLPQSPDDGERRRSARPAAARADAARQLRGIERCLSSAHLAGRPRRGRVRREHPVGLLPIHVAVLRPVRISRGGAALPPRRRRGAAATPPQRRCRRRDASGTTGPPSASASSCTRCIWHAIRASPRIT